MIARAAQDPVPVTVQPDGLEGLLGVPVAAKGVVIFAHGSGSGRLSPRNNHVARGLREAGLATLLIDVLTATEEQDRANVFDIPLLASRLKAATGWVRLMPGMAEWPVGYFGASTGAGAALLAASGSDSDIAAIVSRGGRPDLAGSAALRRVRAPTLLIVGSRDLPVIELNRTAQRHLRAENELVIVQRATHIFEEPGTLDAVIAHATRWLLQHFQEA